MPVAPVDPVGPVHPVIPVPPVCPVFPVVPVFPVGPVQPVIPVEPSQLVQWSQLVQFPLHLRCFPSVLARQWDRFRPSDLLFPWIPSWSRCLPPPVDQWVLRQTGVDHSKLVRNHTFIDQVKTEQPDSRIAQTAKANMVTQHV